MRKIAARALHCATLIPTVTDCFRRSAPSYPSPGAVSPFPTGPAPFPESEFPRPHAPVTLSCGPAIIWFGALRLWFRLQVVFRTFCAMKQTAFSSARVFAGAGLARGTPPTCLDGGARHSAIRIGPSHSSIPSSNQPLSAQAAKEARSKLRSPINQSNYKIN